MVTNIFSVLFMLKSFHVMLAICLAVSRYFSNAAVLESGDIYSTSTV